MDDAEHVPTILDKIVADKRREIEAAKSERPESELRAALDDAPPIRDFLAALRQDGPIKLIAEVKKASPSKGVIREHFCPVEVALIYQEHGAACLSVLTDEKYFQGQLQHLQNIRSKCRLPILRKDFLLDTYQLLEARLAGADAVLLIAECLDDDSLARLVDKSLDLGITPLVEFHEPENLPRVLKAGAELIGVNNRDLRTLSVDLEHTIRMRRRIPPPLVVVGESGVGSRADVERLEAAGVNAILVGEHLMSSPDIGAAVAQLLGR